MKNMQDLHDNSWKKGIRSFWLVALFLLISIPCIFADSNQAKTVTGTVTDNTGETLIGVSVSIKGTTTGTLTDIYLHSLHLFQ